MSWWMAAAAANAVITACYLGISAVVLTGIGRHAQWRSNPLALATGAIFLSCGIGHGLHFVHLVLPSFGPIGSHGAGARAMFDWHLTIWDGVTATVAVWYLSLRNRLPSLVRGAAIYEDLEERRRQALDIHDNVVQGLTHAKLAFELGRDHEGLAALDDTLAASRVIVTDLLIDEGSDLAVVPGDLRRSAPAGRIA